MKLPEHQLVWAKTIHNTYILYIFFTNECENYLTTPGRFSIVRDPLRGHTLSPVQWERFFW